VPQVNAATTTSNTVGMQTTEHYGRNSFSYSSGTLWIYQHLEKTIKGISILFPTFFIFNQIKTIDYQK